MFRRALLIKSRSESLVSDGMVVVGCSFIFEKTNQFEKVVKCDEPPCRSDEVAAGCVAKPDDIDREPTLRKRLH